MERAPVRSFIVVTELQANRTFLSFIYMHANMLEKSDFAMRKLERMLANIMLR